MESVLVLNCINKRYKFFFEKLNLAQDINVQNLYRFSLQLTTSN